MSTSRISTLVKDSNAEKGKIKNWTTHFVFEKGESHADDMTRLSLTFYSSLSIFIQ